MTPVTCAWLGRVDYEATLARQLALREQVWAGEDGLVLLCEHPPVITLGRSATPRPPCSRSCATDSRCRSASSRR